MKVFKFGGASVKDGAGIRNLARIVSEENEDLVVVVSAFGKTTNALEKVLKLWMAGDKSYKDHLDNIYSYHSSIAGELFPAGNQVDSKINLSFIDLEKYLGSAEKGSYDFEYDQVVSYGEILSTIIVAEYLSSSGIIARWVDIRKYLLTDDRYRDAGVIWPESTELIRGVFDFRKFRIYVTQGFIGGTAKGYTTTLGREGSDYTAAILANILNAECVIVWKDVPGLLNADPKWLPDATKLDEVSYREAVEMTFSGAKVIHPKTIKPLHNKDIPLHVKSFIVPHEKGTVVKADAELKEIKPVFVRKENQILISILPRDFSFAIGDNLGKIFQSFYTHGIRVNLVEASAVSIDVCVDDERPRIESLLSDLKSDYSAFFNENVEMLSVRHYNMEAIERITSGRDILVEQRTRSTVRFVVRRIATSLRSSQ